MIGGSTDKIINTTFRWTGLDGGATAMGGLAAGAAAASVAVIAAGKAVWDLAVKTTALYAPFEDMSARVGIAASDLHALSLAAEQSGSSFDAITTGLRRMPSFLNDAQNGMESATRSLDALGIGMDELAGMSIEDQFYRLVDALGAVQDESTRAALAQDVFGRGGQQLMPIIEEGTGALRQFAAEARETGMVLDDEAYAAADRFQDAIQLMQAKLQGALMEGIEPMLPRLIEMADRLSEIAVDALPDLLRVMELGIPILDGFAWALERVVGGIDGIGVAWTAASDATTSMLDFLGVVSEVPTYSGTMVPGYTPEMAGQLLGGITPSMPGAASDLMRQMGYAEGVLSPFREDVSGVAEELAAANNQAASLATNFSAASEASAEMLDAERARNELIDHRMQILEKQQSLEEEQAAAAEAAAQAVADRIAEKEQAEYDARLERLQTYADLTTQVMGAAWDSLFSDTRQSFGDMLKDMMADMLKSGFLNLIRKGILGGASGGLGFFF